jgi:ribosome maturation factor RimP
MIDTARLEEICERGLAAVGYDLVDIDYVRDQQGWVLRVYIDHPFVAEATAPEAASRPSPVPVSQISLRDCELASHHLGTVLDVEDIIPNAYRLEVSSPGVPRPLHKERDFVRFVGHQVKVQLHEAVEGRKNFAGRLHSAGAGMVGVELEGGRVFQLPLRSLRRARLATED